MKHGSTGAMMSRTSPRLCVAPQAASVEKLTKQIRVGAIFLVSEALHANLIQISQLTGNAPMLSALRMSAVEGSAIVLQKLLGVTRIGVDADRRIMRLIDAYADSISACALANGCSEIEGLEIILQIGSTHGELSGWVGDEKADMAKA
jgi:hypothetical protein